MAKTNVRSDKRMSYIDLLIENCKLAKTAIAFRIINVSVDDQSILSGIQKAIYIIEEIGGSPEETFLEFSRYKKKKVRKCPKPNTPSQVLYVGSSTTGVKKRIEQHMGHGHKDTYALHLCHWFSGKYKLTVKQYDVTNEVLQIIEDDLSDSLKPAFGKQGGNNK